MTLQSKIPAIIASSEAGSEAAVRKAEILIELRCKQRSRVKTGNMQRGWQHLMLSPMSGVVFNLVHYVIYNEYGTIYMDAQPMLTPAVEETRAEFIADVAMSWHGQIYFNPPGGEMITRNV